MPSRGESFSLAAVGHNADEESDVTNGESASSEKRTWYILKNVLVVSFGFLLLFTAFQSVQNLQSSINSVQGLGIASLATIYAALVVSCMFVPTYMIRRLGLKYTLVVSVLMYSVYFVANFYPTFATMIPASIVLGSGGAPLWTAKCAYLTALGTEYAGLTGQVAGDVITRFFGVFFMIFQTGQIWGNLISYYVLRPDAILGATNVSVENCGIAFSTAEDDTANTNLQAPDNVKIYTLMTVYTVISLSAALALLLFLDHVDQKDVHKNPPLALLVETLRHLRKPYQCLLIPLTIFSGLEQAFLWGDFTQAYVSCSWGIHRVGFVMITFGFTDAVFSMLFGAVIRKVGRLPIFLLGAVVSGALVAACFLWKPMPDQSYVFFLIAGFWGLADAVWQTQVNAFYSVLFPEDKEAAFANYRLWESLGFIVAFGTQKILTIHFKLILLSTVLALGMLGYIIIEINIMKKKIALQT
ncbi:protein unc-93 homolog A-like [Ornithodoros turicata]|uniref:protein unc-93 homolog A-like n=1 Tax=Ornithodoros turicata TaxID=34597 RepID=UPI0031389E16